MNAMDKPRTEAEIRAAILDVTNDANKIREHIYNALQQDIETAYKKYSDRLFDLDRGLQGALFRLNSEMDRLKTDAVEPKRV